MINGIIDFIKGIFALIVLVIIVKVVFYPFKEDEGKAEERETYQKAKVAVENLIDDDTRNQIFDNVLELAAEQLEDYRASRKQENLAITNSDSSDEEMNAYIDSIKNGLIYISPEDTSEVYSILRQCGWDI